MRMPGIPLSLQQLVEEHYASLYRYAYRLSGSGADAEDLVQETFCKAQVNLDRLRDPGRVKPWLFSILRNEYRLRMRSEQQVVLSLSEAGELAEPLPDPLPPIDSEQLQKALNELPEVYRTPIILYYFEDFGYREIAEQMELPIGTVMSRLARAKAHLRASLASTREDLGTKSKFSKADPSSRSPSPRRATYGL